MPTALWHLQLRSGIHAHCDLELAVEVRQSRRRQEEERREGGEELRALIKSNRPHLAGVE